jgi:hypothetical protein
MGWAKVRPVAHTTNAPAKTTGTVNARLISFRMPKLPTRLKEVRTDYWLLCAVRIGGQCGINKISSLTPLGFFPITRPMRTNEQPILMISRGIITG